MPHINEDGSIDSVVGNMYMCDQCGKIVKTHEPYSDEAIDEEAYSKYVALCSLIESLFKSVRKPEIFFGKTMCYDCTNRALPALRRMRDIIELDIFVNKLGKAINEKRNKDNRPS